MEKKPLVKMTGISKYFPGVLALDNVNLELNSGEILALAGENGSGKSTLVKILGGLFIKDEGEIYLNNQLVNFTTPKEAQLHGIIEVHQELNIFSNLSVAENIFINRYNTNQSNMFVVWDDIIKASRDILNKLDPTIDPEELAGSLDICQQHIVEIARALTYNPKILILDEPTSAMPEAEIEKLFSIIKKLSKSGLGIIYISHHIGEFFELADRIIVLRDGKLIGSKNIDETNEEEIVEMMVGRNIKSDSNINNNGREFTNKTFIFEVKGLDLGFKGKTLSFRLKKGEILGITGLLGCGMHELGKVLFGIKNRSADILIDNKNITIHSPEDAISKGIAFVPENRKKDSLVLNMSVKNNLTLGLLKKLGKLGFLNIKKEKKLAQEYIKMLDVRTSSIEKEIQYLSGGNQQKIVIARWLACNPRILIVSEPTNRCWCKVRNI